MFLYGLFRLRHLQRVLVLSFLREQLWVTIIRGFILLWFFQKLILLFQHFSPWIFQTGRQDNVVEIFEARILVANVKTIHENFIVKWGTETESFLEISSWIYQRQRGLMRPIIFQKVSCIYERSLLILRYPFLTPEIQIILQSIWQILSLIHLGHPCHFHLYLSFMFQEVVIIFKLFQLIGFHIVFLLQMVFNDFVLYSRPASDLMVQNFMEDAWLHRIKSFIIHSFLSGIRFRLFFENCISCSLYLIPFQKIRENLSFLLEFVCSIRMHFFLTKHLFDYRIPKFILFLAVFLSLFAVGLFPYGSIFPLGFQYLLDFSIGQEKFRPHWLCIQVSVLQIW